METLFRYLFKFRKKIFILSLLFILSGTISMYVCNKIIVDSAGKRIFTSTDSIPYNKTGLLLGTAKLLRNGMTNPYYAYRIAATIKLFNSCKIKYVIISGDNGRNDYNEPETMRADLIAAGIDSTKIYLDYAGFRTFDSMIRVKEVFGQTSVTVISQKFHNERALYTASKIGINAIGFNATDVPSSLGFKTNIRERFARVKVFLDFIFGNSPKFLGNKIVIPD